MLLEPVPGNETSLHDPSRRLKTRASLAQVGVLTEASIPFPLHHGLR